MANAKRQVLIVHGWSDSYESFQPLKNLLVATGYQTTQVFLGTYASMRDDVTFDDLATGLQRRFVEMEKAGTLKLDPFSLVAKGANENGSDGTIRAAAASLNSIKINANYTQPDHPQAEIVFQPNEPFAFRIMPGMNHSTIVPRAGATATNATFAQIQECLNVATPGEYQQLRERWEGDTTAFFEGEKAKPSDQSVDPHQQFIVRMRDEIGNDVTDYRLEFHVVDASIRSSAWQNDEEILTKLQAYQDFTMFLTEEVLLDVQPHSVNPSYRTFFVNLRRLEELRARLQADARRPYIGMNVDAVPRGLGLTYATDELRYFPVDGPLQTQGGRPVTFFKESTSTLVDISLQGVQGPEVIRVL